MLCIRYSPSAASQEVPGTPLGSAAPARHGPRRARSSGKAEGEGLGSQLRDRPPAAQPSTGRRTRRSAASLETVGAKVVAFVKANPGLRLEEIGRGLGADTAGLKLPVKELMGSGRLRTEGQKRGTKYFVGGGTGGRKAAKRGKAKAKRKARKAPARKAGKRGRRKA